MTTGWLLRHFHKAEIYMQKLHVRNLSTTACLGGIKSRTPYDKRFPIVTKDVAEHKEGGSKKFNRILSKMEHMNFPQLPGYYDKRGRFHLVPEMIPEFVVPDLTDFQLQPYVSYRVEEITQGEFTAKDLFNACIAQDIVNKYQEGDIKDLDSLLPQRRESSES